MILLFNKKFLIINNPVKIISLKLYSFTKANFKIKKETSPKKE